MPKVIKYYEESFAYHIEVELGLNLDDIWNWEKNNELGINPYETYKSSGKKIWLYCQKHDYHNDNGGYQITCNSFYNGCRCSYCGNYKIHYKDSLAYNYPHIANMIAIEENNLTFDDCCNIACKSKKKFYFKCLDCNTISSNKRTLANIITRGYVCEFCSDGISIPEKFMSNILKQLNINYKYQLNKSDFEWCGYFKYDFYLPKYNMIIETHGKQHYKDNINFNHSLEQEQMNDLFKYKCAKNHVDNYIVIDCRYSELEWLKENITKELEKHFNLSNTDWKLAWEESQNSLCVKSWELWNNGIHSTTEIGRLLNLDRSTVLKYLKIGKECGKCNYTKESLIRTYEKGHYNSQKIICLTTKRLFNTIKDGATFYKIKSESCIGLCCRGKRKTCGGLKWKYIDINHNKILRGEDINRLHIKGE